MPKRLLVSARLGIVVRVGGPRSADGDGGDLRPEAVHRGEPLPPVRHVPPGVVRGKCAIVLVNDRGPYGRLERVIDLSEAAADYLGVGVSWVNAEILVPTSRI